MGDWHVKALCRTAGVPLKCKIHGLDMFRRHRRVQFEAAQGNFEKNVNAPYCTASLQLMDSS